MNTHQKGLRRPEPRAKLGRLILIGHITHSTALLLESWLQRTAYSHVNCHVIDTSPRADFSDAIKRLKLSYPSSNQVSIEHVQGTDEKICEALLKMVREVGRGVDPIEIVVQVPAGGLPEVTAACRQIASRWFRGSTRKRRPWAYSALIKQPLGGSYFGRQLVSFNQYQSSDINDIPTYESVSLERLRNCLVSRHYPRRPSVLLAGEASESSVFLARLLRLSASWLSVAQLTDDHAALNEYRQDGTEQHLVFGKEDFFKAVIAQRSLNNSTWILPSINHSLTRQVFLEYGLRSRRMRLPEVVLSWTASAAGQLVPLWVTRPLAQCSRALPRFSCYEPSPELEHARRLWESDHAKVVALVGRTGTGKTALVQHLLEQTSLTTNDEEPAAIGNSGNKADGIFVWDFYAEPFPETFLKSFATYLNPERKVTPALAQCLPEIRTAVNRRNLRRIILVLDGLEAIQRVQHDEATEGKQQDQPVFELLSEIGSGALPVIAFITARSIPGALAQRIGDGYIQIDVGQLPLASARNLLRTSGGISSDDNDLTQLAEAFQRHPLTLYHGGRFLQDFCAGDLNALTPIHDAGAAENRLTNDFESWNVNFNHLFARYQQHLPEGDVAVLKCLAIAGQPLSAGEFRQIFAESDENVSANSLGPVALDEIESRFNALHGRRLVGIHRCGKTNRYATLPALTEYFANSSTAEVQTICLQARSYFERQLVALEEADYDSTDGCVRTDGAARSRRVPIGARNDTRSTNPMVLDLIERIINHTVRGGQIDEAWQYYELQLGDEYLEMIGESSRARRIKSSLTSFPENFENGTDSANRNKQI